MPINILDQALASRRLPPKGIKVSPDLWRSLLAAGRIKWTRGYLEGVIDSGFDLPVIDGSIFVHVDPELDPAAFLLPPGP
jgi:hypothetical protein